MAGRVRRRTGRRVAAVLLLLAVLTSPVLSLGPSAHAADVRPGASRVAVPTDAVPIAAGARIVPVPADRPVDLEIALAPARPGALAALVAAVDDPGSARYHRFLSEGQYEQAFRPTDAAGSAVASYFAGFGGRVVGQTTDHVGLRVRLSVGGAEQALGVQYLSTSDLHGRPFVTARGGATLPAALRPYVQGIGGLSVLAPSAGVRPLAAPRPVLAPPAHGAPAIVQNLTDGAWWFTGSDFAQGYGMPRLFPGSTAVTNTTFAGSRAVATILMSGYNTTTGRDLPPFDPVAVAAYFNDTFPTSWPQPAIAGVPIVIDRVTPPLPGPTGPQNDSSGNVAENSIDLEMAGSFAPGATLVNFYFAASLYQTSGSGSAALQGTADDFGEALAAALNHSYGSARLAAVTNSYGLPDLVDPLWNAELVHAAATGVTVVAASGDQGNAPESLTGRFQGPNPTWPASSAANDSGTVAVGGITVNLSGRPAGSFGTNGTLYDPYDPTVGSFTEQTAWYDTLGVNLSGSEGGISGVFAEPYWQQHSAAQPNIVNASLSQGASVLGRAEPDVAFPANSTIAYVGTQGSTVLFDIFEGTSIAAPIFAGWLAEVSAVAGHPFGFVDPELYRIASYYAARPGSGDPFTDVTTGGNYLFNAGPGWDAVTGWGTLDPVLFLAADANRSVANYSYVGPTPGLPNTPHRLSGPDLTRTFEILLVVIVVGIAFAVIAIVYLGRSRGPSGYGGPPPGLYAPTPGGPPPRYGATVGGPPPATFLCPYCGSVRPAEPVRCPACGAF